MAHTLQRLRSRVSALSVTLSPQSPAPRLSHFRSLDIISLSLLSLSFSLLSISLSHTRARSFSPPPPPSSSFYSLFLSLFFLFALPLSFTHACASARSLLGTCQHTHARTHTHNLFCGGILAFLAFLAMLFWFKRYFFGLRDTFLVYSATTFFSRDILETYYVFKAKFIHLFGGGLFLFFARYLGDCLLCRLQPRLCVCVCVCVRARARARWCVCVWGGGVSVLCLCMSV